MFHFASTIQKKTKKKSQQPKASNWFEKCTVEQLKQLCKAATIPVSGTKDTLVERLLSCHLTQRFTYEYSPIRHTFRDFEFSGYGSDREYFGMREKTKKPPRGAGRPDGMSTEQLKQECREKGLKVSGKRFDFVLRLLQKETAAKTGVEPPKAAGTTFDEASGKFLPKPRAKSMKLPDPEKIHARMLKKAFPEDTSKWSNNKYKYHTSDCVHLTNNVIEKEIWEKKLLERGEHALAWKVVRALIKDGWLDGSYDGLGRCQWEMLTMWENLTKLLEGTADATLLGEQQRWLRFLNKTCKEYGFKCEEFRQVLDKFFPETAGAGAMNVSRSGLVCPWELSTVTGWMVGLVSSRQRTTLFLIGTK